MSDFRDKRPRSPESIVIRQPAGVGTRPHWMLDDRFLSLLPGVIGSFIIMCGVELSGGTLNIFIWLGIALGSVPLMADEIVIRRLKPEFRLRNQWKIAGFVIGGIVFMPLIITPQCGVWGDKCKPAHQSHHVR